MRGGYDRLVFTNWLIGAFDTFCFSYQDRNSKAWFCYCACLKWVGVRLDLLSSVLVTIVTFAAIFLSSNAGKCD